MHNFYLAGVLNRKYETYILQKYEVGINSFRDNY